MDPIKPGPKTSEFIALVASIVASVVAVLAEKVPPDSVWVLILGMVGAAAAYAAGRSYVKGQDVKAKAIVAAAGVPPVNPPKP